MKWILFLLPSLAFGQVCEGDTDGCIRDHCSSGYMQLAWDDLQETTWPVRVSPPTTDLRCYEVGIGDSPPVVLARLCESWAYDEDGNFVYIPPKTTWHILSAAAFNPIEGQEYHFHVRSCTGALCSTGWAPMIYDDILQQCREDYAQWIGQPYACFVSPPGCETSCYPGAPVRYPLVPQCQ